MNSITDSVWAKRGAILLLVGLFLPLFRYDLEEIYMFWYFLGGEVSGKETMIFMFLTAIGITAVAMCNSTDRQTRSLTLTIMTGIVFLYLLGQWSKLGKSIDIQSFGNDTAIGLIIFLAVVSVFIGLAILSDIVDNKNGKMIAGISGSVAFALLILPLGEAEASRLSDFFDPDKWETSWDSNIISGMLIAFSAMAIGIFFRKENIEEYIQRCNMFGKILIIGIGTLPLLNMLFQAEGPGSSERFIAALFLWSKFYLVCIGYFTIIAAGVLGLLNENLIEPEKE
jgi:hypothetical protein|tara:strand:+ start:278 stop:1126 length:849 start_codon:yes stop_codon:yes gene_type:complete